MNSFIIIENIFSIEEIRNDKQYFTLSNYVEKKRPGFKLLLRIFFNFCQQ